MTKEEFKNALKALKLSQSKFAREIDVSHITVNRWANGALDVPGYAAAYLRLRLNIKNAVPE